MQVSAFPHCAAAWAEENPAPSNRDYANSLNVRSTRALGWLEGDGSGFGNSAEGSHACPEHDQWVFGDSRVDVLDASGERMRELNRPGVSHVLAGETHESPRHSSGTQETAHC